MIFFILSVHFIQDYQTCFLLDQKASNQCQDLEQVTDIDNFSQKNEVIAGIIAGSSLSNPLILRGDFDFITLSSSNSEIAYLQISDSLSETTLPYIELHNISIIFDSNIIKFSPDTVILDNCSFHSMQNVSISSVLFFIDSPTLCKLLDTEFQSFKILQMIEVFGQPLPFVFDQSHITLEPGCNFSFDHSPQFTFCNFSADSDVNLYFLGFSGGDIIIDIPFSCKITVPTPEQILISSQTKNSVVPIQVNNNFFTVGSILFNRISSNGHNSSFSFEGTFGSISFNLLNQDDLNEQNINSDPLLNLIDKNSFNYYEPDIYRANSIYSSYNDLLNIHFSSSSDNPPFFYIRSILDGDGEWDNYIISISFDPNSKDVILNPTSSFNLVLDEYSSKLQIVLLNYQNVCNSLINIKDLSLYVQYLSEINFYDNMVSLKSEVSSLISINITNRNLILFCNISSSSLPTLFNTKSDSISLTNSTISIKYFTDAYIEYNSNWNNQKIEVQEKISIEAPIKIYAYSFENTESAPHFTWKTLDVIFKPNFDAKYCFCPLKNSKKKKIANEKDCHVECTQTNSQVTVLTSLSDVKDALKPHFHYGHSIILYLAKSVCNITEPIDFSFPSNVRKIFISSTDPSHHVNQNNFSYRNVNIEITAESNSQPYSIAFLGINATIKSAFSCFTLFLEDSIINYDSNELIHADYLISDAVSLSKQINLELKFPIIWNTSTPYSDQSIYIPQGGNLLIIGDTYNDLSVNINNSFMLNNIKVELKNLNTSNPYQLWFGINPYSKQAIANILDSDVYKLYIVENLNKPIPKLHFDSRRQGINIFLYNPSLKIEYLNSDNFLSIYPMNDVSIYLDQVDIKNAHLLFGQDSKCNFIDIIMNDFTYLSGKQEVNNSGRDYQLHFNKIIKDVNITQKGSLVNISFFNGNEQKSISSNFTNIKRYLIRCESTLNFTFIDDPLTNDHPNPVFEFTSHTKCNFYYESQSVNSNVFPIMINHQNNHVEFLEFNPIFKFIIDESKNIEISNNNYNSFDFPDICIYQQMFQNLCKSEHFPNEASINFQTSFVDQSKILYVASTEKINPSISIKNDLNVKALHPSQNNIITLVWNKDTQMCSCSFKDLIINPISSKKSRDSFFFNTLMFSNLILQNCSIQKQKHFLVDVEDYSFFSLQAQYIETDLASLSNSFFDDVGVHVNDLVFTNSQVNLLNSIEVSKGKIRFLYNNTDGSNGSVSLHPYDSVLIDISNCNGLLVSHLNEDQFDFRLIFKLSDHQSGTVLFDKSWNQYAKNNNISISFKGVGTAIINGSRDNIPIVEKGILVNFIFNYEKEKGKSKLLYYILIPIACVLVIAIVVLVTIVYIRKKKALPVLEEKSDENEQSNIDSIKASLLF